MSVRQSLLAILDQGPCYGYQLRGEFDRRTGSTWPVNVGQIYNTLDRLERDGLVEKADMDAEGQNYYQITEAGSAEVPSWLGSPVLRTGHPGRAGDQARDRGHASRRRHRPRHPGAANGDAAHAAGADQDQKRDG